jgi:6-phosphogluconate dehydrogenase
VQTNNRDIQIVENEKAVSRTAARIGISIPATSAALTYYDAYRCKRLPHNLLQAQRDYFGAHTYERLDQEGVFHTDWLEMRREPE